MSIYTSAKRGLLSWFWTPAVEQLRFRNRPNLKNPLPPHFKRAKMLRICEPTFENEPKVCKKSVEAQLVVHPIEENPYGVFLVKEMRKDFHSYPMIAIFHTNSFTAHQFLHIRGMLFDSDFDMTMKLRQNTKVMRAALSGTKFEPVLSLLSAHITFGYCRTTNVSKLLQVTKKMPAFILIGLIVDNRLLNKEEFEYYSKVRSITAVQAQVCHTLSAVGGQNLSSTLASNSLALSQSLASHAGSQSNSGSSNANATPTPTPIENEKE